MSKFVTITKTIEVTDGGTTVVDMQSDYTIETMEFSWSSANIPVSGSLTFCVKGTDVAGITDPMVLPLTNIRGFHIEADAQIDIKEDGAAASVQAGPGSLGKDNCMLSTLEVGNGSGVPVNIKYVVWGDR